MKKKLAILLSVSLLACTFGMAGCAAQNEPKIEVGVTNLDVSQSKETADKLSKPNENSKNDSSNSKEASAVSSVGEKSGQETSSSAAEPAEPSEIPSTESSQEPSSSVSEPSESTPAETSQSSRGIVQEPSQKSQETSKGTLTASQNIKDKYGEKVYYSSVVSKVNHYYPGITQEQFDRIVELRCRNYGCPRPYKEGIIIGSVSSNDPKLTLENMKDIISKANSCNLESDKDVYKKYKVMPCNYSGCYSGYILNMLSNYPPPDIITEHNLWCYWPSTDENGEIKDEEISIMFENWGTSIRHNVIDGQTGNRQSVILYKS